jgi:hypothetical protein
MREKNFVFQVYLSNFGLKVEKKLFNHSQSNIYEYY